MHKFISTIILFVMMFSIKIGNTADSEKTFNSKANVVGDNINVREKPSVNSKSIGLLLDGTGLICEKKTIAKEKIGNYENYWYYCEIGGSPISGWIYGEFIKLKQDEFLVFNKDKYYKSFDATIYPKSFNKITEKKWSDIKPSVKFDGERGGPEIFFYIEKGVIYLPTQYIENPIYLIENISEVSKNNFSIKAKLIHADYIIRNKDELNRKFDIQYNENDNTIMYDKQKLYSR